MLWSVFQECFLFLQFLTIFKEVKHLQVHVILRAVLIVINYCSRCISAGLSARCVLFSLPNAQCRVVCCFLPAWVGSVYIFVVFVEKLGIKAFQAGVTVCSLYLMSLHAPAGCFHRWCMHEQEKDKLAAQIRMERKWAQIVLCCMSRWLCYWGNRPSPLLNAIISAINGHQKRKA